ncbi:hypothetical protein GBAR_LOCUS1086 [Geodia barretti]|uniref:Uncharacterized protein n=1 Tax=Geodia barretti TaxID=519541 RepID=A0AA35VUE8_GEOBA|nr:hypothetical protein GBAR_LOCUS1086 [Geodia barretti]
MLLDVHIVSHSTIYSDCCVIGRPLCLSYCMLIVYCCWMPILLCSGFPHCLSLVYVVLY